jgi:CP family cyanate transporter-like MFS transporter
VTEPGGGGWGRAAIGVGILLIAFNLRAVFSSLSPLLPELMAGLGVTPAAASLVTTGPILCLGLFAPVAPALAARYGVERVVLAILLTLAVGTVLRGIPDFAVIAVGSLLAGAAIAMMNVLMPGLVKRHFADRPALMTGGYSMAMCLGAALAAGVTAPLAGAFGSWNAALAFWSVPALAAALFWATQAMGTRSPAPVRLAGAPAIVIWREPIAWRVTLFMGSQSALAYSVFGWLAPILRERGMDPVAAGLVLSLSIFSQVISSFVAPSLATRGRDQRPVALLLMALALAGLLGCLFGPLWSVWLWGFVQGLGQGGLFSVTMTIIILRSPDAPTAASLSGMAQGGGYLFASLAPLIVGLIRTWTGAFDLAGWLFCAAAAVAVWAAWGAGRDGQIGGAIRPGS